MSFAEKMKQEGKNYLIKQAVRYYDDAIATGKNHQEAVEGAKDYLKNEFEVKDKTIEDVFSIDYFDKNYQRKKSNLVS